MQRASQPPSLRAGVPNKLELRPSPRRLTLAGNAARSAIPALWGPVVYRAKLKSSPPSSSPQACKQEEPQPTSYPTQGEVEVKGIKEEEEAEEQSTKKAENESTMPPKAETSEGISNYGFPNEKAEEGATETNAASNKTTETVNLGGEVWQVVERRKTGIRGLEEWVTVSQRQGDKGAPTVMEWIVQKKGQAEDREVEAEGKQEEEEDATVEEIVFEEEEEEAEQPKSSLQRTESEYEFYQMLTGGVSHRLKELQQIEALEEELTLNTETGDATFTASPGTTSAAVSLSSTPTSTVHIRSPLKSSGRHPPKLANVVGETFGSGENSSEDEKEESSGGRRDREESFSRPKTMTIHTPLLPREMRIPLASMPSTTTTTASESTSSATRSAIWQRSSAATGRSAHATVSSSSSAVSTRRSVPKKQTKTGYVKSASLRFTRRKLHNGSNSSSSSEKGGGSTILHRPIRRNKTRAKDDNDIHKNKPPPTSSFTAKTPVLSGLHRVQSVRALEKEKGEAEKEEDSKNKAEKTNRKQSDRTEQSEENEKEKEEATKEAKEASQKLESSPPRIVIRGIGEEEEEDEKDDDDEEEARENSLKEYKELEDLHRKKEMERVLRLATRRNTQNNIVVQQTDFSVSLHISADDDEEEEEETHGEAGNYTQPPNENVAL
ncbi:AAA domain-containing protein [Balamuthia mandrillaris]